MLLLDSRLHSCLYFSLELLLQQSRFSLDLLVNGETSFDFPFSSDCVVYRNPDLILLSDKAIASCTMASLTIS